MSARDEPHDTGAHDQKGPPLNPIEQRVADVVGGLMEYWGFKRIMGRLWTVLYLSPEPLSAADLSHKLSASAGAISMTLTELAKWGVVKKTWRPGERRDYYEPETSIWKMVSRVFREREMVYIREAIEAFEAALSALSVEERRARGAERERVRFVEERLRALLALARVGEGLLNMLLAGEPIDARPMRSLFERGDK